jgi:hypothetical protein
MKYIAPGIKFPEPRISYPDRPRSSQPVTFFNELRIVINAFGCQDEKKDYQKMQGRPKPKISCRELSGLFYIQKNDEALCKQCKDDNAKLDTALFKQEYIY